MKVENVETSNSPKYPVARVSVNGKIIVIFTDETSGFCVKHDDYPSQIGKFSGGWVGCESATWLDVHSLTLTF